MYHFTPLKIQSSFSMVKRIMNAVSPPAVVTSAVPTTEETLLQNWITPQFNIEQIIIYHILYNVGLQLYKMADQYLLCGYFHSSDKSIHLYFHTKFTRGYFRSDCKYEWLPHNTRVNSSYNRLYLIGSRFYGFETVYIIILFLLYQLFSRVRRTLTIISEKTPIYSSI